MEFLDFIARPLLAFGRFMLWLAWDFFVHTILWVIGWPIWRLVTFGRFPHAGIREYEDSGAIEALMVCAVGLVLLLAGIWLLSKYLGVAF